ncbi:unnamed protein product [Psylliodes chrysocephalus]|uniref:Uncharacterized protein n=1 Tax=Psylliodes chrysocephalus TaxID=3402493 RepID=A0A9P0GHY5_9CUCU|nr:unnamed protein product [Psylliodes chrysocephala]
MDMLKINQYLLIEGEPKPIIKLKELTKDVAYKINSAEIVSTRFGDTIRLVIEGDKTVFLPQRSIQVLKQHVIELGNGKCSIVFTGEKDTGKGNPAALFKIINC